MDDTISNLLCRQIDPGDLLSNEDLVKMIMNDTNTKVNVLWKDIRVELKLDRDHNREVIKNVVDGFCKRLDNLEKFVLDNVSKHSNLIADIELKQETISSYQEQLTCNLGKKVHDLCDKLKNHEKSCHESSAGIHCDSRDLTFGSKSDFSHHLMLNHDTPYVLTCETRGPDQSWYQHYQTSNQVHTGPAGNHNCSYCGWTFLSWEKLEEHLDSYHAHSRYDPALHQSARMISPDNTTEYSGSYHNCNSCDLTFSSTLLLEKHISEHHATLDTPRPQLHWEPHSSSQQPTPQQVLHCNLCDEVFNEMVPLNIHLKHHHGTQSLSCDFCNDSFISQSTLCHHIVLKHHVVALNKHTLSHTCNHCEESFQTQHLLGDHVRNSHSEPQPIPFNECDNSFQCSPTSYDLMADDHRELHDTKCVVCDESFLSNGDLLTHLTSHSGDIDSPLPQLDGLCDGLDLDLPGSSSQISMVTNIPAAPYTLNKEKQLTRLSKNALITDFTIDATSSTNINIQCSSGFYQLVAKPTLSSLLVPNLTIKGVPIHCSDSITPKLDQLRRNVNAVLHFKAVLGDQQESATVHLHHTQQKVQVQGRAAPWFVDNVLKDTFVKEAKDRELNIRQINSQLSTSSTKPSHTDPSFPDQSKSCPYCKKSFRANNKSLSRCGNCCHTFHNSRNSPCFNSHVCLAALGSPPVSSSMTSLPTSNRLTTSATLSSQ